MLKSIFRSNMIISSNKKFNLRSESFLILFFLIPIACWCLKELTNFGTDFGVYYAGSYFISDDYSLYSEHFSHKGPFFYFFIKAIGNLIGWGVSQSLITLFLTLMVFYIPLILVIKKYCKTFLAKITMILISISILFGQNSNSSIAFFQEGLLILSMLPLVNKKYKLKDFLITITFFSLAIFTRIDSIIFTPLLFIHLLRTYKNKNKTKKLFLFILFLTIPILFYLFFSSFFNFTLDQFIDSNFSFNSWYKENFFKSSDNIFVSTFQYFKRPTALLLSSQSLILPLTGALTFAFFLKLKKTFLFNRKINLFLNNLIHHINIIIYKENVSWLIGILAIGGFILTNSDRDYHSLIFTCPLCFLIIVNINKFFKNFSPIFLTLPLYLIYLYAFICGRGLYSLYKSSNYILPYNKTLEYIKDNDVFPEIVGGRGWPYLFANKKPIRAINDWWLYNLEKPYITKNLKKQHEKLLDREKGYVFWINNNLSESNIDNGLLEEIKSKSEKIEDQGYYSMYKIK